jgi:hypothetical protein
MCRSREPEESLIVELVSGTVKLLHQQCKPHLAMENK